MKTLEKDTYGIKYVVDGREVYSITKLMEKVDKRSRKEKPNTDSSDPKKAFKELLSERDVEF